MAGETDFSPRKFRELILYLAERSEDDEAFGATKLNKLLYFCDFEAYRSLGRSITGATYQKLEWGPAAREFIPEQDALLYWGEATVERRDRGPYERKVTIALRAPDTSAFTEGERNLIDRVVQGLRAYDAAGASRLSHEMSAGWNLVEEFESIPYRTALISTDPIPEQDLARARELALQRDWASVRP